MVAPVFIGDEVSAAGFRLAGIAVHSPQADDLQSVFMAACRESALVMITAEYLHMLDSVTQQRALQDTSLAMVVLPDICNRYPVEDLSETCRRGMGMVE